MKKTDPNERHEAETTDPSLFEGGGGKTDPNERLVGQNTENEARADERQTTANVPMEGKTDFNERHNHKMPSKMGADQEAYNLRLARSTVQKQVDKEEEDDESLMYSTILGRAYKFVEKVLSTNFQVLAMFKDMPNLERSIGPVAFDDMVHTVERMVITQQEFAKSGKPVHVDIGYHYTSGENFEGIQAKGLMSLKERQQSNIESQLHGSAFGDGIYKATNPFAYHNKKYGDVGLLVARLQGSTTNFSFSLGHDCTVARKGTDNEFAVLRTSSQCVPIIQYAADLIDKNDLQCAGNKVMDTYVRTLQQVIDEFFNSKRQEEIVTGATLASVSVGVVSSPLTGRQTGFLVMPKAPVGAKPVERHVGSTYYHAPETLSDSGVEAALEDAKEHALANECPICFENFGSDRSTVRVKACFHEFHRRCIQDALEHSPRCPICRKAVVEPRGKMPSGAMRVSHLPNVTCSGCDPGTIKIKYSIFSGIQKSYHENPGERHGSTTRTAYLPNSFEGQRLLKRLY